MFSILLINGPNLNLLGTREPEHYGATTLDEILADLQAQAKSAGVELTSFQSNAEHELIGRVQEASVQNIDFIIINPAALTHTSVGLRDALQAVGIPFIEVHLSNVHAREAFRKQSFFSDIAVGVISGLGPIGYELALQAAVRYLEKR
ncbi:MAG: type II 3-dehydroquinate dehydratase [Gammaproteobacteria bacterium]